MPELIRLDPDAVRDEKPGTPVFDPVEPTIWCAVIVDGDQPDYRSAGDNPRLRTESFVALKTGVISTGVGGTPFYLRTGKRMRARLLKLLWCLRKHRIPSLAPMRDRTATP